MRWYNWYISATYNFGNNLDNNLKILKTCSLKSCKFVVKFFQFKASFLYVKIFYKQNFADLKCYLFVIVKILVIIFILLFNSHDSVVFIK